MSSANVIEVNVTIEAEAVLRDANAMKLATSISKIEGVREINLHVLKGLGLGGDTAVRFWTSPTSRTWRRRRARSTSAS